MPRFFDDYSNTYLTHDSAAGRKQQRRGWKFRENFKLHYDKHIVDWRKGPMGLASAQQAFVRVRGAEDPMITPLPDGWLEDADEVTGMTFYCNEKTGDRTWVRPGFIPPPPPSRGGAPGGNFRGGAQQRPPNNFYNNRGPPPSNFNRGPPQHQQLPPQQLQPPPFGGGPPQPHLRPPPPQPQFGAGPPPPPNMSLVPPPFAQGPPPPQFMQGGPPPPHGYQPR